MSLRRFFIKDNVLSEFEQIHCVNENFGLLLRSQSFADIMDAGVKDAGIYDGRRVRRRRGWVRYEGGGRRRRGRGEWDFEQTNA